MGAELSCCSKLNDAALIDIVNTTRKKRESSDGSLISKPSKYKSKQKTNRNDENSIKKISIEGKSDITPPLPNQHVFQASDSMQFLLDFQPLIVEQAQNTIANDLSLITNDENSNITNSNSISEMNKYLTPQTPTYKETSFPVTFEHKNETEEIIDSAKRLSKFNDAGHRDVAALIRKQYSAPSYISDNEKKPKEKLLTKDENKEMEIQDSSSSDEDENDEHAGSRTKDDGSRRFLLRGQSTAVWDDDHLEETSAAMSSALQNMQLQIKMKMNNRYNYGSGKDSPSSSLFRIQSRGTWTKDDVNEELDDMQQQLAHLIETNIRIEDASLAASSIGDVRINSDEEKVIAVDEEVIKEEYKNDVENENSTVNISDNESLFP